MNDSKHSSASEAELGFLKEIVKLLPAGLTVQDAQGQLLLVNDVAATQLGMDGRRPSPDLTQRRDACQRALTAEGVPTPDHGRTRTDRGLKHATAGVWRQSVVTGIARNPLVRALVSFQLPPPLFQLAGRRGGVTSGVWR